MNKEYLKRVALGCDHSSYEQKMFLLTYLQNLGYLVKDAGCHSPERVDYPDIAYQVSRLVAQDTCDRGIMLDGAGIGSSMACNKVKGIRAALCYDRRTVINSREHNNANVLTLGAPFHSSAELADMVKLWLSTPFGGGRHRARVNKIMKLERKGLS